MSQRINQAEPEPIEAPSNEQGNGAPAAEAAGVTSVPPPRPWRRVVAWAAAVVVVAAALAWGVPFFLHALSWEATDDAFVQGDIHMVSTRVAGYVEAVHVDDNQWVEQGELLLELDGAPLRAQVAAAEAALASAQAGDEAARAQLALVEVTTRATLEEARSQVAVAEAAVSTAGANVAAAEIEAQREQADLKRYQSLRESQAVTEQQFQHAQLSARSAEARLQAAQQQLSAQKAGVEAARAQLAAAQAGPHRVALRQAQVHTAQAAVEQARAKLTQVKLDLSHTQIRAPVAGRVTSSTVEVGNHVEPGQALLAVVPPKVWVRANFKETQLDQIRVGQPVAIHVDAYPSVTFAGHVQSIQRGTGAAFSLLPAQNATGNYVKVVQRVPVKITFDQQPDAERYILAPGMSAVPDVHIAVEPGAERATADEHG